MSTDTQPAPTEQPTILVQPKKWHCVATWHWGDIVQEDCAICREKIHDICLECKSEASDDARSTDKCVVSLGHCNHAFHQHCINRWLQTRQVCPLDNLPWETSSIRTN